MELSGGENQSGRSLVAGEKPPLTGGDNLPPVMRGFTLLPRGRQIAVIVSLASALALVVALLLWSQKTDYARLFSNMPEKEAGEVVEVLRKLNVDFQLERATGAIMVPSDKLHELRLKLASQGFPRDGGAGFELLDKESSFGSSQLLETARFQRALEGEIARSVATIHSVRSARVHLALPKESVFLRQPKKPSASVVVDLNSAYGLDPGQVEAIVHLVASSVPQLEPNLVTVVDQRGHLLNSQNAASGLNLSAKQFDYKTQVEDHLIDRVDSILSPVVGRDGLRTQITADVDFSVTERTQETYNPEQRALRSEQTSEEQSKQATAGQGIPGALTNQPPSAGVAPEVAPGQAATAGQPVTGEQAGKPEIVNATKSATRNFDLDKTISHSRLSTGDIRRLTVAVVVDDQRLLQADGSYATQPYSDEDLGRFTSLVKEAVGYDAARGDRVTVTNAAFHQEAEAPPAQVWEQPWFWTVAKQGGAALLIFILVFAVLRPAIKGLANRADIESERSAKAAAGAALAAPGTAAGASLTPGESGQLALAGAGAQDEIYLLEAPQSYEKRLEFAQRAIEQDSRRVAQVLKTWMNSDG